MAANDAESCGRVTHAARVEASFRDPGGSLFTYEKRVFRIIRPAGEAHLQAALESKAAQCYVQSGRFVQASVLRPQDAAQCLSRAGWPQEASGCRVVEHESIAFPNFPYEWPPEMLHAAASLTLDLARDLLLKGLGLKDATPYNILFRGTDCSFQLCGVGLFVNIRSRSASALGWLSVTNFPMIRAGIDRFVQIAGDSTSVA
jgi:hypothetical protein